MLQPSDRMVRCYIQSNNDPPDVASFSRKETCLDWVWIGVLSNVLLTVISLIDTRDGSNLMNKDLLPPAWKRSDISIKAQQLRKANREVVNLEEIMSLITWIWRPRRMPLVWASRKSCHWRIAWNVVYRLMHTRDIPRRAKNRPLAFETNGYFCGEDGD